MATTTWERQGRRNARVPECQDIGTRNAHGAKVKSRPGYEPCAPCQAPVYVPGSKLGQHKWPEVRLTHCGQHSGNPPLTEWLLIYLAGSTFTRSLASLHADLCSAKWCSCPGPWSLVLAPATLVAPPPTQSLQGTPLHPPLPLTAT